MRISKSGKTIESVESWFELAPPKKDYHWVDGRSAKELAKSFFTSKQLAVPTELRSLLESNPSLGAIEIIEAWPEHRIALDSFPGETRNADLAALGKCHAGTVAITIEAKADEPFGNLIREELSSASYPSNKPARIEALAKALVNQTGSDISDIRYQLLHGVAGSLVLAAKHDAKVAVFVVLEFCGPSCSEDKLQRNADDLRKFVALLRPSTELLHVGHLMGPFVVPGGGKIPTGVPLFVGKAIRQIT